MLSRLELWDVVTRALREDAPWGDLTVETTIPRGAVTTATLVAREDGVFAGEDVARAVFGVLAQAAPGEAPVEVRAAVTDGDRFEAGDALLTLTGPARTVLTGERVMLNLLQRMCGVATLTSRYVAAVAGTGARIVDTRKTTPGLRAFEKHAVVCGGGHNHRWTLSDAVMVKDNHLAVIAHELGVEPGGAGTTEALREVRRRIGHTAHLEVEVDALAQLPAVLAAEPDSILLDNFTLADLAQGVREIAGRAVVEASGNVSLDTVADIAATGVDVISVGKLTHSAPSLDLGLDIRIHEAGTAVGA